MQSQVNISAQQQMYDYLAAHKSRKLYLIHEETPWIADVNIADVIPLISSRNNIILIDNHGVDNGDEGAYAWARFLRQNKTTGEMRLGSTGISDSGAIELAYAIVTNQTLGRLSLYDNNIGDVGAQALAWALQANSSLRYLDLSGNFAIGAAGTLALYHAKQKRPDLEIYGFNFSISNIVEQMSDLGPEKRKELLAPEPQTFAGKFGNRNFPHIIAR